ncbi:MAG: lytic transglycosylase domain-containing protein [Acidobacteriota bacterium]
MRNRIAVVALILSFFPAVLIAQIYAYKNKKGSNVFTNIPSRANARVVSATSASQAAQQVNLQNFLTYAPLVEDICAQQQVDPKLVHAVIQVESDYNPSSLSSKGAKGLMQLLPETAARYGLSNIWDPRQNIQAGVKHLKYLLELYQNDLPLALSAYNAGVNAVDRYGGIPPYRETRNYVRKVTSLYQGAGSFPLPSSSATSSGTGSGDSSPAQMTIYKYRDSQGKLCYSSVMPKSKPYQVIKYNR